MLRKIGASLFSLLCIYSLGADPQYFPDQGKNPVQEMDFTLHDSGRDREVPAKIYFPVQPSRLPLVIFSHGLGASKDSYSFLGKYWASNGYICIHPTHLGSDTSLVKRGRPLKNLLAMKRAMKSTDNWENRPKDISFILDSIHELESKIPALSGKIDSEKIGLAGHSYGAYTTMAVAGALVDLPETRAKNFKDKRIKAFIAMSPQAEGKFGFGENSWSLIERPVMIMTGSKDKEMGGSEGPEWRLQVFNHMPPGEKYSVFLEGASHFTFAGAGKDVDPQLLGYIKTASLAFWDSYLKTDPKGKHYLKGKKETKKISIQFK